MKAVDTQLCSLPPPDKGGIPHRKPDALGVAQRDIQRQIAGQGAAQIFNAQRHPRGFQRFLQGVVNGCFQPLATCVAVQPVQRRSGGRSRAEDKHKQGEPQATQPATAASRRTGRGRGRRAGCCGAGRGLGFHQKDCPMLT